VPGLPSVTRAKLIENCQAFLHGFSRTTASSAVAKSIAINIALHGRHCGQEWPSIDPLRLEQQMALL
jgi:hypothetical protein